MEKEKSTKKTFINKLKNKFKSDSESNSKEVETKEVLSPPVVDNTQQQKVKKPFFTPETIKQFKEQGTKVAVKLGTGMVGLAAGTATFAATQDATFAMMATQFTTDVTRASFKKLGRSSKKNQSNDQNDFEQMNMLGIP